MSVFHAFMPFFFFLILASIFKAVVSSKGAGQDEKMQGYLHKEQEANFTRKRDIPDDEFVIIDISGLPVRNYTDPSGYARVVKAQDYALRKSKLKMMRLNPPMTNLEIKYAYGYSNLPAIIEYEENYNEFVRALNAWAEELMKAGDNDSAMQILNYAVNLESSLSKTYIMLADLYSITNDKGKLNSLLERINNIEMIKSDHLLYNKITSHIHKCLGMEHS